MAEHDARSKSDCFVSVVAPLRDDADIVGEFLDDLIACLAASYTNFEVVLVDDSSADETVARARERISRYREVRLLRLSRSFGQETAITAGLEAVIGDYIVVMLPDSDPPDLIPKMIDKARRGAGIVIALREGRRSEGIAFRACSAVFYWYVNRILGLGIPKESVDYRVLSRKSVNALIQIKDHLRYIRSFSAYVGYGTETIWYTPISRRGRPATRGFWEALNLGVSIVVANSSHPLRLVSVLALLLSAGNGASLVACVGLRLFGADELPGWIVALAWANGSLAFLFLAVAVLCEYVGRILVEIQDRPLYFVAEEWDHGAAIVHEERKNIVRRSIDA